MRVDDFFERVEAEVPVPPEVAAEVDPPFVLAANVHALRTARGMTQGALARAVGVAQPRIAEVERGDANPTLGTLSRLAYALGVTVSELLSPDCRVPGDEAADAAPRWRRTDGAATKPAGNKRVR
jgi:transcriptional regulator with XRE-family HTH domain